MKYNELCVIKFCKCIMNDLSFACENQFNQTKYYCKIMSVVVNNDVNSDVRLNQFNANIE